MPPVDRPSWTPAAGTNNNNNNNNNMLLGPLRSTTHDEAARAESCHLRCCGSRHFAAIRRLSGPSCPAGQPGSDAAPKPFDAVDQDSSCTALAKIWIRRGGDGVLSVLVGGEQVTTDEVDVRCDCESKWDANA